MIQFMEWLKNFTVFPVIAKEPVAEEPELEVIYSGASFPSNELTFINAKILPQNKSRCMGIALAARKFKARYEAVAQDSGVPWFVVAGLHRMESDQNWKACLHNGEPIIGTNKKTKLVPANRGPFATWEDAAIDALKIEWQPSSWGLGEILEFCERYNGLGYRRHGVKSPYVYGLTTAYTKGRYVADGKWSADSIHNRPGIASMLRCLEELGELRIENVKDQVKIS